MKKITTWLLSSILSFSYITFLQADVADDSSFGNESLIKPECLKPFKLTAAADITGWSDFDDDFFDNDRVKYKNVSVQADGTFYYNQKCVEGAQMTLGFTHEVIRWNNNPFFCDDKFNTLRIGLNAFTGRLCDWFWQAFVRLNLDSDEFNFNYYSTWDLLLWGRYSICKCPSAGLHFGFLALTGMKIDRVYPIIGFDWQYSEKFKINAVFPVKLSLEYSLCNDYTTGAAVRFFESRHRVGPNDVLSRGLIQYRATGIEGFLTFDNCCSLFANIHAGWLVGGKLKISNKHNDHGRWYDFDGAAYGGAEVAYKF